MDLKYSNLMGLHCNYLRDGIKRSGFGSQGTSANRILCTSSYLAPSCFPTIVTFIELFIAAVLGITWKMPIFNPLLQTILDHDITFYF